MSKTKDWETAGELVKKLEEIPEDELEFHQKINLIILRQYDPNERLVEGGNDRSIKIDKSYAPKRLREYKEFKKKSRKAKFVVSEDYSSNTNYPSNPCF